jgi:hypothetical protein
MHGGKGSATNATLGKLASNKGNLSYLKDAEKTGDGTEKEKERKRGIQKKIDVQCNASNAVRRRKN